MARKQKKRIFLLSPANLAGPRAEILLKANPNARLARQVQELGAPLGEVFSFVSGLYFRGKLAYANAFGVCGAPREESVLVITSAHGLMPPSAIVGVAELQEMAEVEIHPASRRYRDALERDAARLVSRIGQNDEVVLLGSIATPKYVEPLLGALGKHLVVPSAFIGLGDMARGAMMLRAASELAELEYTSVMGLRSGGHAASGSCVIFQPQTTASSQPGSSSCLEVRRKVPRSKSARRRVPRRRVQKSRL